MPDAGFPQALVRKIKGLKSWAHGAPESINI